MGADGLTRFHLQVLDHAIIHAKNNPVPSFAVLSHTSPKSADVRDLTSSARRFAFFCHHMQTFLQSWSSFLRVVRFKPGLMANQHSTSQYQILGKRPHSTSPTITSKEQQPAHAKENRFVGNEAVCFAPRQNHASPRALTNWGDGKSQLSIFFRTPSFKNSDHGATANKRSANTSCGGTTKRKDASSVEARPHKRRRHVARTQCRNVPCTFECPDTCATQEQRKVIR